MFEKAARQKLRFECAKGQLSVEDLWDLPLTARHSANLDELARGLHRQLKSGDDVSFVLKEKKSDDTIQLKFDIVKHIIDIRLAELDARQVAEANRERKQKLLAIIEQKEGQAYTEMSLEDLRKMVNEM